MPEQPAVIVHGAAYSVYVRAIRLALEAKDVPYELREVDVFAPGGAPADYLARHPFGRIPAFEHDGFALYESRAIEIYIDRVFPGPSLIPAAPQAEARMHQIISILDHYAYASMVRTIFTERVRAPARGGRCDEARIAEAMPIAERCAQQLSALADPRGPYLLGAALSLADLHAAPMFVYFTMTDEGQAILGRHARLQTWWRSMRVLPPMARTRSPLEA